VACVVCGAADESPGAGDHDGASDGAAEHADGAGDGDANTADGAKQPYANRADGKFARFIAWHNLLAQ